MDELLGLEWAWKISDYYDLGTLNGVKNIFYCLYVKCHLTIFKPCKYFDIQYVAGRTND